MNSRITDIEALTDFMVTIYQDDFDSVRVTATASPTNSNGILDPPFKTNYFVRVLVQSSVAGTTHQTEIARGAATNSLDEAVADCVKELAFVDKVKDFIQFQIETRNEEKRILKKLR